MIEFRRKNGRNIPIQNAWSTARGSVSRRGSFRPTEPHCFLTSCPQQCGQKVYLIRHNGGSVWIDPPLGYPWYKHPCMHPQEVSAVQRTALVSVPRITTNLSEAHLLLAVVTQANYCVNKTTALRLTSGDNDHWSAIVKYDCKRLLDELVIVDRTARTIVRLAAPLFPYRLLRLNRRA